MSAPQSFSAESETLSERHREILSLIVEGKSNKEIAEELKIKIGTVKQHMFVLFRKLGVSSRAKAVVVAEQFLKHVPGEKLAGYKPAKKSKLKLLSQAQERYDWRIVSAVAITLPEAFTLSGSPEVVLKRGHFLNALQTHVGHLVMTLDGKSTVLPDGGMLAWFGHPVAHLDDPDRAVSLAQQLQAWIESYSAHFQDKSLAPLLGIGIASHNEVIADHVQHLYAADSFRQANILARYAEKLRQPLADSLTKRLAPACVTWLEIKTKANHLPVTVKGVGDVAMIGPRAGPLPDLAGRWEGLPFMPSILDDLKRGVAQWLAVECWPPLQANSLMDAIGNDALAKGVRVLRLRSPSSQRRDQLLQSYTAQVEAALQLHGLVDKKMYPNAGERLAGLLVQLSEQKPLLIAVYGLKALDGFKWIIGELGIDRLAAKPLLIVAANLHDAGVPKTTLRLLGPRPTAQPFSRVFSMQMPELEEVPEGIRVDLQALLDGLGEMAKALIVAAAHQPEVAIEELLAGMSASHHKTQACLRELTTAGLIANKPSGGFQLRDLATAEAIQRLHVVMPAQLNP